MLQKIDPKTLTVNPFTLIGDQWMLITAGTPEHCNTMTASWGGIGVMWAEPSATCYIRPQRYTKEFVDNSDYFTLCFFDESYRKALNLCGSTSGRDVDKIKEIVIRPEILAKFTPKNDIQKLIGRIVVSNDCAHSFGASRHGKMAGEIADFSSFSFHAVKNFTTAEGGAMTWNLAFGSEKVERQQMYCGSLVPFIEDESWNEFIYRLSQLFSLHGQNKDALAKTKLGAWEYDIIGPWYKCNMTDIMAAMGLVQFERYSEMLKKREEYVAYMNKAIDDLNANLDTSHQVAYLNHKAEDHCSSHHLYLVRLQGRTREEANHVIGQMAERGIATNVHYKPLPMMTAYMALGFDIKYYPNAYNLFENEITLPLNTCMTMEDVEYVMENFVDIVKSL